MKIINTLPPTALYQVIVDKWPEVGQTPYVVFAYGDIIYNPSGRHMERFMLEHEMVHSRQQAEHGGPQMWWQRYIEDDAFRFEQELEAYRREYVVFCEMYKDKNERNNFLRFQALMLSSPMYGNLTTMRDAMTQIKNGN